MSAQPCPRHAIREYIRNGSSHDEVPVLVRNLMLVQPEPACFVAEVEDESQLTWTTLACWCVAGLGTWAAVGYAFWWVVGLFVGAHA